MKHFAVNCTRQQYAVVLAWCRQSGIAPYAIADEFVETTTVDGLKTKKIQGYRYELLDLDPLIDWYSTCPGERKIGSSLYVDETEYMLLALRWPQYHCEVSPSSAQA